MSSSNDDQTPKKSAKQVMEDLLAKRRAAQQGGPATGPGSPRHAERAAAAHSASKSKPAMRK